LARKIEECAMNVELLRKIAAVIQEKPREFDMSYFNSQEHTCGTPHCIGGWAAVLTGSQSNWNAQETLGISDDQWDRLCYPNEWPPQFLEEGQDEECRWSEITAKIATARIEHFIETGGRE
jgi:hypothetical protein